MLLDDGAYTVKESDNLLEFTSVIDKVGDDDISVMKKFTMNKTDNYIGITYQLTNHSDNEVTKALWELSRPPVNGLTFWPTGPGGTWGDLASSVVEKSGHSWLNIDTEKRRDLKLFADGKDGWFAHVDAERRLYIKTFDDVEQENFADGEAELELWIAGAYIELENIGAAKTVKSSETIQYKVNWYLRALPNHISAEVGNSELISYVNQIITGGATNIT